MIRISASAPVGSEWPDARIAYAIASTHHGVFTKKGYIALVFAIFGFHF
jgi:hypothetical protein